MIEFLDEVCDFEEALGVSGPEGGPPAGRGEGSSEEQQRPALGDLGEEKRLFLADCAFLKARVYEKGENQALMFAWLRHAVKLNPYCHAALKRLLSYRALGCEEEAELLQDLGLHAGVA